MGWDISIMKFAGQHESLEDALEADAAVPIGDLAEIRTAVAQFFPQTDWSNPGWGRFETDQGSIEFNLGDEEPVQMLMLHFRADNELVARVLEMCAKLEWTAIDTNSGERLEDSAGVDDLPDDP